MTQPKKQPRLVRVPDAFLPAALAVFSMLRPDSPSALLLYIATLIVSALSLFACRGIRLAFARQPAIRHVRGSVKCALLLTLAGAALSTLAAWLLRHPMADALPLIAAGMLLNIEHIFYEYMYAIGDRRSAILSRGLTALFSITGLLLSEQNILWLVGMAGLSALVSIVVSLVMGDGFQGRLDVTVVRCVPWAALQTALYPAAALGIYFALRPDRVGLPFFVGLTLYELCKTPFRRSPLEARSFNKYLLIACAVAALGMIAARLASAGCNSVPFLACAMLLAAALCAFALFGNIRGRDA